MTEVLSIEKLIEMSTPVIEIPGFNDGESIKVRVQKPKLMHMATTGKIPNHLMTIALVMIAGKTPQEKKKVLTQEERISEINDAIDLYCRACLVEPSYEDFKELMTDEQRSAIFDWGFGEVKFLNSFRDKKGNGTTNNNVEEVPEKA